MPTAIGTAVKLSSAADCRRLSHAGELRANQVSAGESSDATMAIRYKMTTTEAAKAIHLICSRSSPLERRKRSTKLRAETSMQSGNSGRTAYPALVRPLLSFQPEGVAHPSEALQRSRGEHDSDARQYEYRSREPHKRAPSPRRELAVGEEQEQVGSQQSHGGHPQPVIYPRDHHRKGDRAWLGHTVDTVDVAHADEHP